MRPSARHPLTEFSLPLPAQMMPALRKQILLYLVVLPLCWGCRPEAPAGEAAEVHILEGETMGTYYRVSYPGETADGLQAGIDSLLLAFNLEVSTYIDSSIISRFNRSAEGIALGPEATHFLDNYRLALKVHRQTEGAFDPTVMPLVNYWGFGYTPKKAITQVDSQTVDSLLQYVGLAENVELIEGDSLFLRKTSPGVQLDFSAIAKGYGVDLVGAYLRRRGITSFLVDIGGEVLANGEKAGGQPWTIGINVPREDAAINAVQIALPLTNRAIATSGNYRNFHEVEGVKYGHTINPFTGFPERTNLLSASVFAPDCATADAYATACMVVGAEKALRLMEVLIDLDGYFITGTPDGGLATAYSQELASIVEAAQAQAQ